MDPKIGIAARRLPLQERRPVVRAVDDEPRRQREVGARLVAVQAQGVKLGRRGVRRRRRAAAPALGGDEHGGTAGRERRGREDRQQQPPTPSPPKPDVPAGTPTPAVARRS